MAVLALAWAMTSCDDGPPSVARVTVTSPVTELIVGETAQLAVKVEDKDGNVLTDRPVTWTSSNNGFARVSSSGVVSGEGAGAVTITATSEGQSGSAGITIRADPCGEALPITVGQTITGRLSLTDCELDDESLADIYVLTLNVATPLQIDLESVDFDAFLVVTTSTALVAFNDDGAGLGNARIDTTLAPGNYLIWANSFGPQETGAYSLSVGSTAVAQCATVGQITIGQSVSNELATTDCQLGDGTYADGWQFTLSNPTGIVADLRSTAFDAFALITDAHGNRLGFNDDRAPGNTNSLLEITLEPGTYHVWANTFYRGQTGAYTLALDSDACETALPLAVGDTKTGELFTEDCRLDDGSFSDRWALTLNAPATVRLDLASDAFDPYLLVTNAAGDVVATDDDGGDDTDARVEIALPAGTYIVWANTYAAGQTGAYSISATAATSAALNLRIDGAHVTQGVQRFAGTVPLVMGRRSVLRVFGRANVANTAAASVRVRLYHGGALHRTLTIPATASVPTVLGEGTLGLSWNVALDAADVKPGLSIDGEIDPDGVVAESDETDNVYPASGTPKTVDVREVPPFNLTLVPIRQSANGLVGNVNQANAEDFVGMTRQVHPLGSIDVAVRAVYTTTLPALQPQDQNGSWSQLLGELEALRVLENASRSYLGVVKVSYQNGIAGLGYIGRPTAIVWDSPATIGRFSAHELGHTFGRLHSPCGGPGGVDPDYPYDNAAIGVIGYDTRVDTLIPRTAADIMSYCPNVWASDYTYQGVLSFRTPPPPPVVGTQAAQPVMVVWGTVDGGKVTLEPAFQVVARPVVPNKRGPWSLVARDAEGSVLFSHSFDMTEVGDAKRPSAAFAFALPMDPQVASRVHSLRLTGPSGQAERGGRTRAAPTVGRERSADRVTMRWDRDAFPAALLRDTRTGRILSIVRNGQLSVRPEPGLELVLSDGVRTMRERVDEQ